MGARITNDDWGTHPTIAYGVIISAAFFEKDVENLVQMAIEAVPNEGPFAEGLRDIVKWHSENDNWRDTRKMIHDKYYRYRNGSYEAPVSVVSSLNNGLCGIMALLYGEGDFMKTVGIAVSAGYDCDNQAATCAGIIGVIHGTKCLPEEMVEKFNNQYVCFTRDEVQVATPLSEIEERKATIAKKAILENGGRVENRRNEAPPVMHRTIPFSYKGLDHSITFGSEEASISGGDFNEDLFVKYVQKGDRVRWEVWDEDDPVGNFEGFYDGKELVSVEEIFVDIWDDDLYGDITYIINCDF